MSSYRGWKRPWKINPLPIQATFDDKNVVKDCKKPMANMPMMAIAMIGKLEWDDECKLRGGSILVEELEKIS